MGQSGVSLGASGLGSYLRLLCVQSQEASLVGEIAFAARAEAFVQGGIPILYRESTLMPDRVSVSQCSKLGIHSKGIPRQLGRMPLHAGSGTTSGGRKGSEAASRRGLLRWVP